MTRVRPDAILLVLAIAGGILAATPREAQQPGSGPVIPAAETGLVAPVGFASGTPAAGLRGAPLAFPSPAGLVAGTRRVSDPVASGAPRPTPIANVTIGSPQLVGLASWYGTGGPGLYAAASGYHDGTRVSVRVCHGATCLVLPLVTQCGACRWRAGAVLVDLSRSAFLALGVPLSVGLVRVTVQLLGGVQ